MLGWDDRVILLPTPEITRRIGLGLFSIVS